MLVSVPWLAVYMEVLCQSITFMLARVKILGSASRLLSLSSQASLWPEYPGGSDELTGDNLDVSAGLLRALPDSFPFADVSCIRFADPVLIGTRPVLMGRIRTTAR